MSDEYWVKKADMNQGIVDVGSIIYPYFQQKNGRVRLGSSCANGNRVYCLARLLEKEHDNPTNQRLATALKEKERGGSLMTKVAIRTIMGLTGLKEDPKLEESAEDYTIEELRSSTKPYFSKPAKNFPIEFFDEHLRFVWTTPVDVDKIISGTPTLVHHGVSLTAWNALLQDSVPVFSGPSGKDSYMSWRELKKAMHGPNRYMEPSRFS